MAGGINMSRAAAILGILLLACATCAAQGFQPGAEELSERIDGGYFRFLTESGRTVAESAVVVGVGDSYINEENRLFEVVAIDGDLVTVADRGVVEMPDVSDALAAMERAKEKRSPSAFQGWAGRLLARVRGEKRNLIGIYHTHNAESYVPTSGIDSKEYGDIHEVGKSLAEAFEAMGFEVVWRDDSHLPHDGQAYLRSRRTVSELSRRGPATLLDVHRDAIPRKEEYLAEVNGELMSQIRLVVGRQNPNREANLEYAKRIKAIADEKYPGLIKGIFHAKGNYNQDLGPHMILLEFGTHVTSLEQATRSTDLMAEVIAAAAGLTPGAGDGGVGRAGGRSALWILLIAAAAAIGWYFLNKEGAFDRLLKRRGGGGEGDS